MGRNPMVIQTRKANSGSIKRTFPYTDADVRAFLEDMLVSGTIRANANQHGIPYGTARKIWKRFNSPPTLIKPCGTSAAYVRHLRHKEVPCQPCVTANRVDTMKRQAKLNSLKDKV